MDNDRCSEYRHKHQLVYLICLAGVGYERLVEELVKEAVESAFGFSTFKVCQDAAVPDVVVRN